MFNANYDVMLEKNFSLVSLYLLLGVLLVIVAPLTMISISKDEIDLFTTDPVGNWFCISLISTITLVFLFFSIIILERKDNLMAKEGKYSWSIFFLFMAKWIMEIIVCPPCERLVLAILASFVLNMVCALFSWCLLDIVKGLKKLISVIKEIIKDLK